MNFNLLLGIAAVGYGLYTAYARVKTPGQFAKLEAMKKQWGDQAGTIVHVVGYTIVPIVVGVVLIIGALKTPDR